MPHLHYTLSFVVRVELKQLAHAAYNKVYAYSAFKIFKNKP